MQRNESPNVVHVVSVNVVVVAFPVVYSKCRLGTAFKRGRVGTYHRQGYQMLHVNPIAAKRAPLGCISYRLHYFRHFSCRSSRRFNISSGLRKVYVILDNDYN